MLVMAGLVPAISLYLARPCVARAWCRKVDTGFRKTSCSNNNLKRDARHKAGHDELQW